MRAIREHRWIAPTPPAFFFPFLCMPIGLNVTCEQSVSPTFECLASRANQSQSLSHCQLAPAGAWTRDCFSVMVLVVVWLVVDFLCARLGGSMTKCGREPD